MLLERDCHPFGNPTEGEELKLARTAPLRNLKGGQLDLF